MQEGYKRAGISAKITVEREREREEEGEREGTKKREKGKLL